MKLKNGKKKLKEKIIHIYDFQQYKTIRSFGESFNTQKASIVEAREDQSNLLKNIEEFNNKSRPKNKEGKDKKRDTYESAYEGRELTLNVIKATKDKGFKLLTPKQMLQKLPGSRTSKSRYNI